MALPGALQPVLLPLRGGEEERGVEERRRGGVWRRGERVGREKERKKERKEREREKEREKERERVSVSV